MLGLPVVPSEDIFRYHPLIYDYTAKAIIALGGKYCDINGDKHWKIESIEYWRATTGSTGGRRR